MAHKIPAEDRARFHIVAEHKKHTRDPGHLIGKIQEGDVLAFHMTWRQKRDGMMRGNVRTIFYFLMKYAHMAVVVRDPNDPRQLRLYSSEAFRGPNLLDKLGVLSGYSFDVYRLDKRDRLDMKRLREFAVISSAKKNKFISYNYLGMFGIWSNHLEPQVPSDIGDNYICSTSVAAALHYAGLDLHSIRCCEAFALVSPWLVIRSGGHIYQPKSGCDYK